MYEWDVGKRADHYCKMLQLVDLNLYLVILALEYFFECMCYLTALMQWGRLISEPLHYLEVPRNVNRL